MLVLAQVLTVRGSSYTCASGKGGASPFHEVADMCACAALLRPDTSAGTAGAEHVPRSGTGAHSRMRMARLRCAPLA